MTRILTFSFAAGIAAVMAGIAFINRNSDDPAREPKWSSAFFGLVLVYLVLASLAPAVMVPVGLVVLVWQAMHSAFPGWLDQIGKGPAHG